MGQTQIQCDPQRATKIPQKMYQRGKKKACLLYTSSQNTRVHAPQARQVGLPHKPDTFSQVKTINVQPY